MRFGASAALTCVLLGALSARTQAAPRPVNLEEELRSARRVAVVRIEAYLPDSLQYRLVDKQVRFTTPYSSDPEWAPFPRLVRGLDSLDSMQTAIWPRAGSEVVIVVARGNWVSLFARRQGSEWRFWSPEYTLSAAQFACGKVSRPLARGASSSQEGCLMTHKDLLRWIK